MTPFGERHCAGTRPDIAIAWVLRQPAVISALIGAGRIEDIVSVQQHLRFSNDELQRIEEILAR